MKNNTTLLIFLVFSLTAHTQFLNRMNANFSFGIQNHWNSSMRLYFFKHFAVGTSLGISKEETGPTACSPSGILFTKCERLKNQYNDYSFLGGFTTHSLKNVDVDLLFGFVVQKSEIQENMVLKENEYSHSEWVQHTTGHYKTTGFVIQSNLNFEVTRGFGFVVTAEKHFNSLRPAFNFMVGVQIGVVQDFWKMRE